MKLLIDKEPEEEITLKLEQFTSTTIALVAESKSRRRNLLLFTNAGTVYIERNAKIGNFKFDEHDRLILTHHTS